MVSAPRSKKARAERTVEIERRLVEAYPVAVCELEHRNPFELLAATILSARTSA
jgi:endonuclease-3